MYCMLHVRKIYLMIQYFNKKEDHLLQNKNKNVVEAIKCIIKNNS